MKAGGAYPVVTFLHGSTDLTIDTHNGFPKGVWSLPQIQDAHPNILFVPRNRTTKDRWASDGRYNEYKERGHVIDDFAYFTEGFMDWLFGQARESGQSRSMEV